MAHRTGKAYINNLGWVSKKATADRDYQGYEDAVGAFVLWVFRWYPDKLLDILRSPEADYKNEELIQRVMMRAYARKQRVSFTGCRGLTKTSTKFKSKLIDGLVWPGTQSSYYGPSYKQMAAIASKTFHQIAHDYPVLAGMCRGARDQNGVILNQAVFVSPCLFSAHPDCVRLYLFHRRHARRQYP